MRQVQFPYHLAARLLMQAVDVLSHYRAHLALLFELIDSRYRDMLPTVITANYSVEQTVDKLTANGADACTAGAIEDRLQEVYYQPYIDGQSWRRAGRN